MVLTFVNVSVAPVAPVTLFVTRLLVAGINFHWKAGAGRPWATTEKITVSPTLFVEASGVVLVSIVGGIGWADTTRAARRVKLVPDPFVTMQKIEPV